MKKIMLLSILFSSLLITCKKDDTSTLPPTTPGLPTTPGDSILNKNVKIIDSTKLVLNSDTTFLNQGKYEFAFSGTVPDLKIGDVIVGATNGGYIRKINSMDKQSNKIVLLTEQGDMEDVFNNAGFNFSTNMENLKPARVMSGYQFDVSGKTLYNDGASSIILDKGIIDIDGDWNFGFNFKRAKLDSFELSNKNATFNGQFVLKVTASQAATFADTIKLGRVAKYYTFLAGGVPVVVYTEVELKCIFSASISATIKRNLQINTNNKANVELKYKNSQWQSNFTNSSNSTLTAGERTGNANVEIKMDIIPYVSFRLYRILGPYASTGSRELIKGNIASPSLDWDFYTGAWIQTIVGARASILGKSLFDFKKEWNTDTVFYETPYKLEKTSGDIQTGQSDQFLSQPLKVQVLDKNGIGQSNAPVYFSVTSGGGSVETSSILTDQDGYAQTRWKLGTQNVIQTVEAKVKKTDASLISGAPLEFAASAAPFQTPTLTTAIVGSITQTTASSGGIITNDGGGLITAKGVCWSISQNPTTSNSKTNDGTGTGSFISNVTGLTANTTYYVKAYATNNAGTAYGNEISFTTLSIDSTALGDYNGTYNFDISNPGFGTFPLHLTFNSGTTSLGGTMYYGPYNYPASATYSTPNMNANAIFDYTGTPADGVGHIRRTWTFVGTLIENTWSGQVTMLHEETNIDGTVRPPVTWKGYYTTIR